MEAGLYARTTQHIHFSTLQHLINDETLINNIKQSTQPREKREDKEKGTQLSPNQKHTNPKGVTNGQRNKLCLKALTSRKQHIKEGKGKKT
jgi:hypothetical protein